MPKEILCEAWETWCGSEGNHQYKHIIVDSENDAHAVALEFALSLLDPYMNDIKHLGDYMAEHYGEDPVDAMHKAMIECAHYELWERH